MHEQQEGNKGQEKFQVMQNCMHITLRLSIWKQCFFKMAQMVMKSLVTVFCFFGISQMLVAPAKEKRKKKKAPTNTSLSLEPSKTPCFYLHTLTLNYMLWRMTGRNNQLPIPHLHPTYVQTHALAHPLFCFSSSLVQGFNAFSQHKNRILMQKLNTKLKLNTKKNIQCKPMSHILHKHLKKYLTLFYNKDKNCNKLNQECPT